MANLKEYFTIDLACSLRWNHSITIDNLSIEVMVGSEIYSESIFVAFYIPKNGQFLNCSLRLIDSHEDILKKFHESLSMGSGFIEDIKIGRCGSKSSIFSRRIYLYLENEPNNTEIGQLNNLAIEKELCVTIRSNKYADKKMELEKPLAFISHDSRDKQTVAEPIAIGLQQMLCSVWYDTYSLKVGDKLRESIEKGIKETKKCILILSKNFLHNSGWTKIEFNSIFTRELIEGSSVILPVWVGVKKEEIYDYCPSLADRVACIWPNNKDDRKKEIVKLYKSIV